MQKKSEVKLPMIKKPRKESSAQLSKTTPDNNYTPKLRPASSTKVEDLEKKLFNKLEAYESGGRKKLTKKMGKLGKQPSFEYANAEGTEGYERMQKFMPGLYSKLVETKKGSYVSEHLISEAEVQIAEKSPQIKKEHSASLGSSLKFEEGETFITEKQQEALSQEEMERIYKEYSLLQGLAPEATNQEMQQLSQSINSCENDIQALRKSMEGLIREIGMEYINQIQKDYQYDLLIQK